MRKIIKNAIVIMLFLTLSVSTALLAYLHFFTADDRNLSGEWTAELDMTGQAAVAAFGWLQDIEGVSVSLEEMEGRMQGLTIQVSLTFEQTNDSSGTFYGCVSPESYAACNQAACEALSSAFRELLAKRLIMAGYEGGTDEEAMEVLVAETFGMSTEDYLMSCGPALLPPLEELQAWYDGKGAYETTEDILTREFETGGTVVTRAESYIRQEASLILLGETEADSSELSSGEYPMVYTLKEAAR